MLPGELVTLTTKVTQVRGRVSHLSERNIVLRVDGEDHGYSLNWVNTLVLTDERVLSNEDLTFLTFSARLIRVPGLVLGQESPPLFIPLREVERIRISRPVWHWGPARIFLAVIGGALDLWAMVVVIELGAKNQQVGF